MVISVVVMVAMLVAEPPPGPATGKVRLRCAVVEGGRVDRCVVISESPAGQGYGKAAVLRSKTFRLPAKAGKKPPSRGTITIPLAFVGGPPPPDPAP